MSAPGLYRTPQGALVCCIVHTDGTATCVAVGRLWPGYQRKPRTIDAATLLACEPRR